MNIAETLQQTCQTYWDIRNRGELGELRTQSHNDVLSLFDLLHLPYEDREDAALLAKEIINNSIPTWRIEALLEQLLPKKALPVAQNTTTIKKPDWLQPGQLVLFAFCSGEITDVCVSEQHIMFQVKSPKWIWRNHPEGSEWLEYFENLPGMIRPITKQEALADLAIYRQKIEDALQRLEQLRQRWGMNDETPSTL